MGDKTMKIEQSVPQLIVLKQTCLRWVQGRNMVRSCVVLVCLGLAIQQISVSIQKLIDVPITTYTHFDFNKTIVYPSLTFCREPPYKYNKMLEYDLYAHPRFTSMWRWYNFSVPLDKLWEDITYNESDIFIQYGLDGFKENVELVPTLGFVNGRCYTVSPLVSTDRAIKSAGYSITLKHNEDDVATSTSVYPPGYHVYVHYSREPYTEVEVYAGLVDYLYIYIGESIDVKLKVDQYVKISRDKDPCTYLVDYSANQCAEQHIWDMVGEIAGCSGPWMKSSLPLCSNHTAITNLITAYLRHYSTYASPKHDCPRFCRSYFYNAYVVDRQNFVKWDSSTKQWYVRTGVAAYQSQLYVYFNSMMVSVYEESYNYDWNIFIGELGGSVGFLLGLSVVGLMSVIVKTYKIMSGRMMLWRKTDSVSISSTSTGKTDHKDLDKYDEWLTNNNMYYGLL